MMLLPLTNSGHNWSNIILCNKSIAMAVVCVCMRINAVRDHQCYHKLIVKSAFRQSSIYYHQARIQIYRKVIPAAFMGLSEALCRGIIKNRLVEILQLDKAI